jgi:hypothetical protein
LVHLAAGVSGLLFLLAVGLWIASYRAGYEVRVGSTTSFRLFLASRGEVGIGSVMWGGVPSPLVEWSERPPWDITREIATAFPNGRAPIGGFMFRRLDHEDETGFVIVSPLPFVAALFALLPLADVMLIRRRRRRGRRLAAGLCVACGYDLRASPERCPECGATPAAVNSL